MNDDVKRSILSLVASFDSRELDLVQFKYQLEPLFYQLAPVTNDQDRSLEEIINDLEQIRFSFDVEHQRDAAGYVLEKIQLVLSGIP